MKVNRNEQSHNKALLIDGNSLFFKAFYGTYSRLLAGQERSRNDEPINAIRTFSLMILNLIKKFNHDYLLVAFDKGSKTFRHNYGFYKAQRKKQPDELYYQLVEVKKLLKLLGIPFLEADAYEADDIIGIYSKRLADDAFDVSIITTDKDLLQLVNDYVTVYLSKSGVNQLEEYNVNNFYEKMECNPYQIPDLKALMGDSSDNIKGVEGIGPKSALKLISEFSNIETIINNIDDLPEKWQKKIAPQLDELVVYKKLTQILQIDETGYFHNFTLIERKTPNIKDAVIFLNQKSIFNVAEKIKKEF